MIQIIEKASIIEAAGTKGKIIEEYFGHVNSKTSDLSVAKMRSPEGWEEPGQCPEFDEYTVVLKGSLLVKTKTKEYVIKAGQAILTGRKEWIQYSTPFAGGAEYIAVCLPAFSMDSVKRDK